MDITSHFIGIKINSYLFENLFVSLEKYLKKNNLIGVIELQNLLSFHISLYYLEKDLSSDKLKMIKEIINKLNRTYKNISIIANRIAYFKKENLDILGYLSYKNQDILEKLNLELADQFNMNEILDNQFIYIPHTSLFKILNNHVFQQHKERINEVVQKELSGIKTENLFEGFFLFAADSTVHPEKQFIVSSF